MLILLALISLAADETVLQETVKEPESLQVDQPESHASAQVGGALAAGNTSAFNISFGFKGHHKEDGNKLEGGMTALLGQAVPDANGDGRVSEEERETGFVVNQRQATGHLRYDRFLGEKNSVYALAGLLIDPFAGFASRTHQQVGYSRNLLKKEHTQVLLELGFDWAQERYTPSEPPREVDYQNVFAARAMVGLKHKFNDAVNVESTLEIYPNVRVTPDIRVLSASDLSAKLTDQLALRTTYGLRFDNQPVEGFRKADHAITTSLVLTIL